MKNKEAVVVKGRLVSNIEFSVPLSLYFGLEEAILYQVILEFAEPTKGQRHPDYTEYSFKYDDIKNVIPFWNNTKMYELLISMCEKSMIALSIDVDEDNENLYYILAKV